jgi:glycosyltransferase involved in cell wall biosynthesis
MNNLRSPILYIQADNVHVGGGRSLLNALIQSKFAEHAYFLLDARMPLNLVSAGQFLKTVSPTIIGRLIAQFWLWRNLLSTNILLCFGNLPPLFNVKGKVVVFVQNRYVIDDGSLKNLSFKVRVRLFFERVWFNNRCNKVDEFIVQTPSMQMLLKKRLQNLYPELADRIPVKVLSFMGQVSISGFTSGPTSNGQSKNFDFIYPASGEVHKNHKNLIDAFIILAEEGHFPSLVLTLDVNKFNDTLKSIELAKDTFKLNILNMGFLSHEELFGIYRSTRYLVYPSLYESFGIPLLEAKQAGLFIVAAELDYVRDSINPDQSFNPDSAVSIARAIKRSLGISEDPAIVLSADEFLSKLISPV